MVDLGIACSVDGLAIGPQPGAEGLQAIDDGLFDGSLCGRSHAEQQCAALCRHLDEGVEDFLCRLIRCIGHPSPVVGEGDAAFPGIVELHFGYATLRSLVVFVLSGHGTVHTEESGVPLTGPAKHLVEVHIVAFHPSAVKPKDVERTIVGGEFR